MTTGECGSPAIAAGAGAAETVVPTAATTPPAMASEATMRRTEAREIKNVDIGAGDPIVIELQ